MIEEFTLCLVQSEPGTKKSLQNQGERAKEVLFICASKQDII